MKVINNTNYHYSTMVFKTIANSILSTTQKAKKGKFEIL